MTVSAKEDFSATEWKGQHSGVHKAAVSVAKTQAAWEEIWKATHSNIWPAPVAPVLPEGKMALAVFAGQQNVPAVISIGKIEEAGGETVVDLSVEKSYPKAAEGMFTAAVMYEPFLLKWVDKTETPIVFAKTAAVKPAPGQRLDI